jgi:serine/threonine-protein kinase
MAKPPKSKGRGSRAQPKEIQLGRRWTIGRQIGDRSGFGRVYEATGEDGTLAAAKFVPKQPGAERELLFVELSGVPNVVPVLDTGETPAELVIVMPRAERSLRNHLEAAGGRLSVEETVAVLRDIAAALDGIGNRVVHRDLKPENILLLNDTWCIADFGISRYAEASTSSETHKFAMTPAYAAPERWRFEHATVAADVYALGIMAHEMLVGSLPFPGPDRADFRSQHLNAVPPVVTDAPPALASLITEALVKAPAARPGPSNLVRRLDRVFAPSSEAAAALQAANRTAVTERVTAEAAAAATRSEAERREALFDAGKVGLTAIADRLKELILENAPEARPDFRSRADWWSLKLRDATIAMDPPERSPEDWDGRRPPFDVIAHATIAVQIPTTPANYAGRSHSLWYCDAKEAGVYRWYEVAFMYNPFATREFHQRPAAIGPGAEAGQALGPGSGAFQVAYPFTSIDQGDEEGFFERWVGWFAKAAAGSLQPPSRMPETDDAIGSWRRG